MTSNLAWTLQVLTSPATTSTHVHSSAMCELEGKQIKILLFLLTADFGKILKHSVVSVSLFYTCFILRVVKCFFPNSTIESIDVSVCIVWMHWQYINQIYFNDKETAVIERVTNAHSIYYTSMNPKYLPLRFRFDQWPWQEKHCYVNLPFFKDNLQWQSRTNLFEGNSVYLHFHTQFIRSERIVSPH